MQIESSNIKTSKSENLSNKTNKKQNNSSANFANELNELKKNEKTEKKSSKNDSVTEKDEKQNKTDETKSAISQLNDVINELNQSDDKNTNKLKNSYSRTDNMLKSNKNGEQQLINNDFNIQEPNDKLPQMNPNMNFGGDGQPFSSFMSNNSVSGSEQKLSMNVKDLEEEAAILSTMAENAALASKMNINEPAEKTVQRNDGIKKVDAQTGITKETLVKFDTIIMNEADVEVFANLVESGEVNLNNLVPEAAQKAVQVSKTLADMLAKSMEENKPVRIEFDNGISVIIKVSRDGKISADFLPSTQVAEAYLKENLPILKQRFDEQNLEYDSLNQRERRNQNREQQRKKGSDNE